MNEAAAGATATERGLRQQLGVPAFGALCDRPAALELGRLTAVRDYLCAHAPLPPGHARPEGGAARTGVLHDIDAALAALDCHTPGGLAPSAPQLARLHQNVRSHLSTLSVATTTTTNTTATQQPQPQPQQQALAGAAPVLPSGWIRAFDEGRQQPYYYDTINQRSQWEVPTASALAPHTAAAHALQGAATFPSVLPPGWATYREPRNGQPYYFNTVTQRTQWEFPTGPAAAAPAPAAPAPACTRTTGAVPRSFPELRRSGVVVVTPMLQQRSRNPQQQQQPGGVGRARSFREPVVLAAPSQNRSRVVIVQQPQRRPAGAVPATSTQQQQQQVHHVTAAAAATAAAQPTQSAAGAPMETAPKDNRGPLAALLEASNNSSSISITGHSGTEDAQPPEYDDSVLFGGNSEAVRQFYLRQDPFLEIQRKLCAHVVKPTRRCLQPQTLSFTLGGECVRALRQHEQRVVVRQFNMVDLADSELLSSLALTVNALACHLPDTPRKCRSKNARPLLTSRALDITRLTRPGSNTVRFQPPIERAVLVVLLVRVRPFDEVFREIVHRAPGAAHALAPGPGSSSDDDGVEFAEERLSLQCPLTLARIVTPVKGTACTHRTCFDLAGYLSFCAQIGLWECPICSRPCPAAALRVDTDFVRILEHTPADMLCVLLDQDDAPATAPPAKVPRVTAPSSDNTAAAPADGAAPGSSMASAITLDSDDEDADGAPACLPADVPVKQEPCPSQTQGTEAAPQQPPSLAAVPEAAPSTPPVPAQPPPAPSPHPRTPRRQQRPIDHLIQQQQQQQQQQQKPPETVIVLDDDDD